MDIPCSVHDHLFARAESPRDPCGYPLAQLVFRSRVTCFHANRTLTNANYRRCVLPRQYTVFTAPASKTISNQCIQYEYLVSYLLLLSSSLTSKPYICTPNIRNYRFFLQFSPSPSPSIFVGFELPKTESTLKQLPSELQLARRSRPSRNSETACHPSCFWHRGLGND